MHRRDHDYNACLLCVLLPYGTLLYYQKYSTQISNKCSSCLQLKIRESITQFLQILMRWSYIKCGWIFLPPLHYNNKMFSCYVKNLPAILLASRNRMFYSIDFLKNSIAKAGIKTIITYVHKAKNGSVVYYKSACKSMLTLLNSKCLRKSS